MLLRACNIVLNYNVGLKELFTVVVDAPCISKKFVPPWGQCFGVFVVVATVAAMLASVACVCCWCYAFSVIKYICEQTKTVVVEKLVSTFSIVIAFVSYFCIGTS